MAVADSVPGVSGGTIAFILGFYDEFIYSLNNLVSGTKEERIEALKFLMKIGSGWIIGLVLSILLIASIFEENIYQISSVFLGLILVAIPLIVLEEKEALKGKYSFLIFTVIGALIVFLITYFNPVTSSGEGVNVAASELTFGLVVLVLIAGMIAISAMVLPGISGSTILLIMGLYAPIIGALKGLFGFDFSYLPVVIIFGIGILLGIVVTIRGVKHALDHYRSQTIYTIVGLMIGSLYAVVNGPKSLEIPQEVMTFKTFSIFYFILGGLVIVALNELSKYFKSKRV
jgi:putative membrane protein